MKTLWCILILCGLNLAAWAVTDAGYSPTNYNVPALSFTETNTGVLIRGYYRGTAVDATIPFSSFVNQMANLVPGATNAVGVPLGGNATFTNLTLINPIGIASIIAPSNCPVGAVLVVTNGGQLTWSTNAGSGSISITNYTISIQQLVDSGTYVSLNTNVAGNFPFFSFALTNRLLLGTVPSFSGATVTGYNGYVVTNGIPPLPNYDVQWSADGTNWNPSTSVSYTPVYVSLYDGVALADTFSNITVSSYASTNLLGTTNDFTGQVTLVNQTADSRSAVSVAGATGIAAGQAALWSQSPAVSAPNISGYGVNLNSIWSLTTISNGLSLNTFGTPLLTGLPLAVSNAPATVSIVSITTNIVLQITGQSPPTVQFITNIFNPAWVNLPGTVTTFVGGNYIVTAPLVTGVSSYYFRAVSTGVSSAAALSAICAFNVSGLLTASNSIVIRTNASAAAPQFMPGAGILWNSNNALYWVTSAHTNLLSSP